MTALLSPPPTSPRTSLPSFVEELLREQQELSAVERFAQRHEAALEPTQARYYRSLLPASPPGPGEQYGFDVDLDRCSGCKACVTACHAMNGLDDHETWRDVGLLVGGSRRLPVLQHVTTACHHCVEPGCLAACPTQAYEKDPQTGIVKHLDDQCFGCQYCVLACPYEVPKYHAKKGIVRKCDMCSSRLKAGEAPACVQACPHEAIRIKIVNIDEARTRSEQGAFLATAPDPRHTVPTTTYRSSRALPIAPRSGDEAEETPEHAHVPLIAGLIISQISVGLWLAATIALWTQPAAVWSLALCGAVTSVLCALAATAHLGRPWLAYRAFLGWRTSWLSREILALGGYQNLTFSAVGALWWFGVESPLTRTAFLVTALTGLTGVLCSAMIYAVTPRPFWRFSITVTKFLGTTGLALCWACILTKAMNPWVGLFAVMVISLVKIAVETRQHRDSDDDRWLARSSRLLQGPLYKSWCQRVTQGLIGGVALPLALVLSVPDPLVCGCLAVAFCAIGEVCERVLFFRAAASPRMPGAITA